MEERGGEERDLININDNICFFFPHTLFQSSPVEFSSSSEPPSRTDAAAVMVEKHIRVL